MEKLLKYSMILALLVFAVPQDSQAQCNDQLLDKPAGLLEEFTYLRDFRAKLKKGKKGKIQPSAQYSLIMNKGTKYRFITNSAAEFTGHIVFELYDRRGKLISSFDAYKEKHYDVVDITCKATGVHKVVLTMADAEEGCGVVVLGFSERKSSYERYLE